MKPIDDALLAAWLASSEDEGPRYRRLNFDIPGGPRIGISVPEGVEPDALVAEFAEIERQVAFYHTRRIINLDGPPSGLLRRLRWAWLCTTAETARRVRQAWAYSFGRRAAERKVEEFSAAFRHALAPTAEDAAL